ncbi:MAG TPA: DUF1345 domain-containing protein [Rhizomicrobium sp.]
MKRYLHHHGRFAAALLSGIAAFLVARLCGFAPATLLGGDIFFVVFLVLYWRLVLRQTPRQLEQTAKSHDEGVGIVILVTLAALAFFSDAVFIALNQKHQIDTVQLGLAVAGAPLGWFVLHTVMAFHYANLHYFDDPETDDDNLRDLEFPHTAKPGLWDFAYFSFVIGMTAQVSDVQVRTMVMRRAVLGHGLVSFFFNTVFIAMAVNAVVAIAG